MAKNKQIIIAAGLVLALLVAVVVWLSLTNNGTIIINTNPSGADFYIDSKVSQGFQAPVTLKIKAGKHQIWILKAGYEPIIQEITVKARRNNQFNFDLTKSTEPNEGAPSGSLDEPKISNLPYENEHFRVSWDLALNKYLVVPKIPFLAQNAPQDDFKNNWGDYQKYGREALIWIKNQGVTPTKDNIEWWGEEWWPENANAPSL